MSGLGLSFEGREGPEATLAISQAADALGIDTLWLSCHLFQRDPIALAGMILAHTKRIKVALMAMSPFSMHPVYPVMSAATLDEWYPGRVILSYGTGAPGDLASAGIEAPQPPKVMRETFAIARQLLAGEIAAHEGEKFRVKGRRLMMGGRGLPVALAASQPQMLALSGEISDGVVLSSAASVEFVRWSLDVVEGGAKGRKVKAWGLVHTVVDDDVHRACGRLRQIMAFILRGAHHTRNLELAGSVLDQKAIYDALAVDDWARAASLVSDEVVRRHAAVGSASDVRARLAAYRAAGLDEIVLAGIDNVSALEAVVAAAR